jgi:hypothetical protein
VAGGVHGATQAPLKNVDSPPLLAISGEIRGRQSKNKISILSGVDFAGAGIRGFPVIEASPMQEDMQSYTVNLNCTENVFAALCREEFWGMEKNTNGLLRRFVSKGSGFFERN